MKYQRLLIFLLALGAIILAVFLGSKTFTCQANYRDNIDVRVNSAVIKTEIAGTPAERTRGLSGRECIGKNQGMLFVFDKPDYYPFWMKNMRFPIDIIWIDASKKVVYVKSNVAPSSYPQTFVSK